MTILFLNWKNIIRITFTFKNEHPQKNSVINPMRIQFLKNFGFALNSSLPKKNRSLRIRHGCQKDGKPTENMKNVRNKKMNDTLRNNSRTGFARNSCSRTAFRVSRHTRFSETMYQLRPDIATMPQGPR